MINRSVPTADGGDSPVWGYRRLAVPEGHHSQLWPVTAERSSQPDPARRGDRAVATATGRADRPGD